MGEVSADSDRRGPEFHLMSTNLPTEIYDTEWDVVIDSPKGYFPEAPGRMTAIYTAGIVARNRKKRGNTDIFVHGVDRSVEEIYSKEFLCDENLVAVAGRLAHFSVLCSEGFQAVCLGPRREIPEPKDGGHGKFNLR